MELSVHRIRKTITGIFQQFQFFQFFNSKQNVNIFLPLKIERNLLGNSKDELHHDTRSRIYIIESGVAIRFTLDKRYA